MHVPVTIYTEKQRIKRRFRQDNNRKDFTVYLSEKPVRVVLDEDYDIARRLSIDELPPVVGQLFRDEKMVVVESEEKTSTYESVLRYFKKKGASLKKADTVRNSDIKAFSIVICGLENKLIKRLFGTITIEKAGFSVLIKKNPLNPEKVIGIFNGETKEDIENGFKKIFHYGKYSRLLFNKGKNIYKEIEKTQRGLVMNLEHEASAVDISKLKELFDVIEGVADKKIIYVGEVHDVFAHHAVQLDIIKGIFKKNKRVAIGMEMFQKPFQETLDRFIAGTISEKEFLKQTEYFKRWGFDYNLYKPILDFARKNKLPVLAMNIQREIIEKVSRQGIDSLTKEEAKEIPSGMDFSDSSYRERLHKVFKMHRDWKNRNFEYFYQSQIIWDETMSQSIDEFLRKNPDYQIVVLAGKGHLEYGSGIPNRTSRRNKHSYAIVLIDAKVERDIADYVIFPKPVEGVTAPKLMTFLSVDDEGIRITGFPENSVSEEAGLKVGDLILSLDNDKVQGIEDIKIHLLYRKEGETIKVRVKREKQEGYEELEYNVKL
jgi:uncharacterized iron-regulated protein